MTLLIFGAEELSQVRAATEGLLFLVVGCTLGQVDLVEVARSFVFDFQHDLLLNSSFLMRILGGGSGSSHSNFISL